MFGGHFYHGTIRRFVSVFGTLFNDIRVIRTGGSSLRVPLAYGPKDKFLARIDEQTDLEAPKVAIKLPRMSFEILNIVYDTQSKLNRNNRIQSGESMMYTYAPYNISLSLSVMAKNQDDALQILEQIVPYFQPEYTVTIKESFSADLIKTDVPITLSSIDMTEDYEGDFMSRRAIIYTLSFDAKVRFYGPERKTGIIKKVVVNTLDTVNPNGYETQTVEVYPKTALPRDQYELIEEITEFGMTGRAELDLFPIEEAGNEISFIKGELVVGYNSSAAGIFSKIEGDRIFLLDIYSEFEPDETIVGKTSNAQRVIKVPSHYY
jgi:hypothetical protein